MRDLPKPEKQESETGLTHIVTQKAGKMRTSEDRNQPRTMEALAASPNIAAASYKSGVLFSTFDTFVPAVFSAVLGGVAGLALGQLLIQETRLASIALGTFMAWSSYNGFYFLDRYLSTSRVSAEWWDGEEEEEEAPDGFIRSARNKELKRLSGRMRSLLHRFAVNYDEVDTTAIGAWYKSKHLNRKQIEDVRSYIVLIGAAVRDDSGGVSLTEWGRSQLPKWAANDFKDVIELSTTSPTPAAS